MKRKPMTVKRLARLLSTCLEEPVRIMFLTDPDRQSPTWEEVGDVAFHAYMTALEDVEEALEGNPSYLKELLLRRGKTVILDPERDFYFHRVPPELLEDEHEVDEHMGAWATPGG